MPGGSAVTREFSVGESCCRAFRSPQIRDDPLELGAICGYGWAGSVGEAGEVFLKSR